jgi:hypothetical protein
VFWCGLLSGNLADEKHPQLGIHPHTTQGANHMYGSPRPRGKSFKTRLHGNVWASTEQGCGSLIGPPEDAPTQTLFHSPSEPLERPPDSLQEGVTPGRNARAAPTVSGLYHSSSCRLPRRGADGKWLLAKASNSKLVL